MQADTVEAKPFEKKQLFEGCLPIEEMARRGPDTLRFGPMRPIGLHDPHTGKVPFAVIQLRTENRQKTLYNLVGFQTRLKWGTQKEILTAYPGIAAGANFARFGAMHRNTFLDSTQGAGLGRLRIRGTNIFCAGQLDRERKVIPKRCPPVCTPLPTCMPALSGRERIFIGPDATCIRALTHHLTSPNPDFQPMNFNFGLLPVGLRWPKKQRKTLQIEACQKGLEGI